MLLSSNGTVNFILGDFAGADKECRTTLTDPQFVDFLQSNDFITWGGDIRDKEAWSSESYSLTPPKR